MSSASRDGWLFESGPNSLQETTPLASLVTALGLDPERIVAGPAAKNRYIVRGGRLVPVPTGPHRLLSTPLFSLAHEAAAARRALHASRGSGPPTSAYPSLVRDHFGQEMVDYAINPLVAGIYAGDPDTLSTKYAFPKVWEIEQTHGSLIRGMIASMRQRRARGEKPSSRIVSFTRGLQTLPDALAARLPAGALRTRTAVVEITSGPPLEGRQPARRARRRRDV